MLKVFVEAISPRDEDGNVKVVEYTFDYDDPVERNAFARRVREALESDWLITTSKA